MKPHKLHESLEKLAPITGISIGDASDRSTWRIDFTETATEDQKNKARKALLEYDEIPDPLPFDQKKLEKFLMEKLGATKKEIDDLRIT